MKEPQALASEATLGRSSLTVASCVPSVDLDEAVVWDMLSEPRMAPYLEAAGGDKGNALRLYEWSARTSSAAFEVVGHQDQCGIPWFLMPTPGGVPLHSLETAATTADLQPPTPPGHRAHTLLPLGH